MSSDRNPRVSQALAPNVVAHPTGGRTALAQGAVDVSKILVEDHAERITGRMSDELLAASNEFLQETVEGPPDPFEGLPAADRSIVDNFVDIQARLVAGAEQAPDRFTELKMRQERIMRDYMRRYPKLTQYFQQAANGQLGYSPIGTEIRQLAAAQNSQNEAMKEMFDAVTAAAERARVPAYLRLTNPNMYFELAIQEMNAEYDVARLDQNMHIRKQLRSGSSMDAQEDIRKNMGSILRFARPNIMATAEQAMGQILGREGVRIESLSPVDRQALIETGAGETIKTAILTERDRFLADYYTENFAESDMTMEQLQAELRPVLDLFDFAAENYASATLAEDMERLVKTRESSFMVQNPELQFLNLFADLLTATEFSSAQVSRRIQQQIADRLTESLNGLLGGQNAGGAWRHRPMLHPETRQFDPRVLEDNLPLPEDLEGGEEEYIALTRGVLDVARQGLSTVRRPGDAENQEYINTRRAASMVMLSKWANSYLDNWEQNNRVLPEAEVDRFVALLSHPQTRDVFRAAHEGLVIPGFDPAPIYGSIERIMASEAGSAYEEIERAVVEGLGRTWQAPFQSSETHLFRDLVDLEWDTERSQPRFILDEEAMRRAIPPTASTATRRGGQRTRRDWERLVAEMNNQPEVQRLGQLVRATAHANGDSDYVSYAHLILRRYLGLE